MTGEVNMSKTIVITAYGHDRTIDKIAVSIFDETSDYYSSSSDNAKTYCSMINSLKTEGDSWINAKVVSGNTPYLLGDFRPVVYSFMKTIMNCDSRGLQKILREVDSNVLSIALKDANEELKEKVFNNMSKRAVQMLKDDMDCLKNIDVNNINEAQEKIMDIIRHLKDCGEIVINFKEDE
jgi:flagellar motor switch protein FliG